MQGCSWTATELLQRYHCKLPSIPSTCASQHKTMAEHPTNRHKFCTEAVQAQPSLIRCNATPPMWYTIRLSAHFIEEIRIKESLVTWISITPFTQPNVSSAKSSQPQRIVRKAAFMQRSRKIVGSASSSLFCPKNPNSTSLKLRLLYILDRMMLFVTSLTPKRSEVVGPLRNSPGVQRGCVGTVQSGGVVGVGEDLSVAWRRHGGAARAAHAVDATTQRRDKSGCAPQRTRAPPTCREVSPPTSINHQNLHDFHTRVQAGGVRIRANNDENYLSSIAFHTMLKVLPTLQRKTSTAA